MSTWPPPVSEPVHNPYAPPVAAPDVARAEVPRDDNLGWAILAIPAAAGIVGPLLTLLSPGLVSLIGFPMIIATAVLVAKDAPRWGLRASHQVLGVVLLWMIYFPVYFHRRAKKGAPKRVGLAILSQFVYLGGFFILGVVSELMK